MPFLNTWFFRILSVHIKTINICRQMAEKSYMQSCPGQNWMSKLKMP